MTVAFEVPGISRRVFLGTATAAAATLPVRAAPAAKFTRYNATSPQGQAMLASYERAVQKLLKLDPHDPRNWFRNAFIHFMDCPHGNWWFFAWHRPFVGYFEQTVRDASGNPNFAFPYWDWTQQARIPAGMFAGALDPTSSFFNPYISSFDTFFKYLNPALSDYWKSLSSAQRSQLNTRGIPSMESMWEQVRDYEESAAFTTTPYARYLTRSNPWLDPKTKVTVSWPTVKKGLAPTTFDSFNSQQTPSHNTAPSGDTVFGILEGQPHNMTHNNIGGVGHIPDSDYLDFGYMADNLSPVDPVFFLHHANMDRLWDVWTRKQQSLGLQTLPQGSQWTAFAQEPFLFYMDRGGKPAARKSAEEAIPIAGFDYTYQPGTGEELVRPPIAVAAAAPPPKPFAGTVTGGGGKVSVPETLLKPGTLVASITIPHPMSGSAPRDYDVLVNAPPGTTHVDADSPYYVGTVSFFGFMPGMTSMDVTFHVPINRLPPSAKGKTPGDLVFTVVPAYQTAPIMVGAAPGGGAPNAVRAANGPAPLLKAVSVSVSP